MAKLGEKAFKAMSKQMNLEFLASHTYLQAAYWFDEKNYQGIYRFFKKESEAERQHDLKFSDYISMRGNLPEITDIKLREFKWEKPLDVFQSLYDMEVEFFHNLQGMSKDLRAEGEQAAANFVAELLKEQENSVNEFDVILSKVKSYVALPGLLWHLDKQLGD